MKTHRPLFYCRFLILGLFLANGLWGNSAIAQQISHQSAAQRLLRFFSQFESDPRLAMDQIPPKFDSSGNPVFGSIYFTDQEVVSGDYVTKKDWARKQKCPQSSPGKPCQALPPKVYQGMDPNNQAGYFLENSKLVSLAALSEKSTLQGQSLVQPWSGDYWPTYRGGLASRYADQNFPNDFIWKEYEEFFGKMFQLTDYSKNEVLAKLSPSEKYDLLLGDKKWNLTQYSIQNSRLSVDDKGQIENWFGLCHGWAPAAYRMDRPIKPIDVTLADGRVIRFFPDDLKALSTLLWANARVPTHFVGGRCDTKNPKKDPSGRIIDSDCWDTNPATFHLIMTNHMGIDKNSLVMDATYDYEVWNQPIVSYQITFFHPETRETSESWSENVIPLSSYKKDPFKKFRSPHATHVVGVQINVTYSVERTAAHQELDSPEQDNTLNVDYYYDLELNQQGEIIGGEWYQNTHPDFLWTPVSKANAQANGENLLLGEWDGKSELPQSFKNMGMRASAVGIPMNIILQKLIQRSRELN